MILQYHKRIQQNISPFVKSAIFWKDTFPDILSQLVNDFLPEAFPNEVEQ